MSELRVVMVLSGGGAKAAAHLGVARALQEAGIAPIRWIGTSLGSVMAVALAAGQDPEVMLTRFRGLRRSQVVVPDRSVLWRNIWSRALLRREPLHAVIAELLQPRTFGELHTPCTITATERLTGREIAFGTDGEDAPLLQAIAASCALPPYYRPVVVNGREFIDGGVSATVPLRQAARVPCDVVVAVDVGPGFDETGSPAEQPPPLIAASDTAIGWLMAGTARLMQERWQADRELPPLVWLRPVTERAATFAVERASGYAESGYHAMQAAMHQLTAIRSKT